MALSETAAFSLKTTSEFDPAHGALWDKVEPSLAELCVERRLHQIKALTDDFDFVYELLDNNLLVVEKVAVWFSGVPDTASVVAFMTSLGITWANAGNAPLLQRDKMLVSVEVICFANEVVRWHKDRLSGGPSLADPHDLDTPMDPSKAKTYDGNFERVFGYPPQPLLLGPPTLLGNFMRQFLSGVFVEVNLKYVVLFSSEVARWHGTRIVSDVSSGKQQVIGKAPTKEVRGMADCAMRLKCCSYSRLYLGVAFRAPISEFPGTATVGVTGGARYQYDMYTHELFCGTVDEIFVLLGEDNMSEFKYRFNTVFRTVHSSIRRSRFSYCDALQRELVSSYAFLRAPPPYRPPKAPLRPSPQTPVVPGIPGGEAKVLSAKRTFEEIQQLPGFIKGLKTYGAKEECPQLATINPQKKLFCQYYPTGRECSFHPNCNRAHLCDVIQADKKTVCCQPHTRQEHVASLGLPQYS